MIIMDYHYLLERYYEADDFYKGIPDIHGLQQYRIQSINARKSLSDNNEFISDYYNMLTNYLDENLYQYNHDWRESGRFKDNNYQIILHVNTEDLDDIKRTLDKALASFLYPDIIVYEVK